MGRHIKTPDCCPCSWLAAIRGAPRTLLLLCDVMIPPLSSFSGTGQLQTNPPVVDLLCRWKPTRRTVAMMGFVGLIVGEGHLFGPSCQQYNWKTGK